MQHYPLIENDDDDEWSFAANDKFVIMAHRSAASMFGEAEAPVKEDGVVLEFDTFQEARIVCDLCNRKAGPNVSYTVTHKTLTGLC